MNGHATTFGLHDPAVHGPWPRSIAQGVTMCTLCDWWGTRWALWHEYRASIGESHPIAPSPSEESEE